LKIVLVEECGRGVVINGDGNYTIPPGLIGTKSNSSRRQYAAHPSACKAVAIIFQRDALAEALHHLMLVPWLDLPHNFAFGVWCGCCLP